MVERQQTWTAQPFVPSSTSLRALERAARKCRGCPLFEAADQVVFGQGSRDASIVLVGEQPGDQEDRTGHPFVGPAGRVLWSCLDDAGIERRRVYVTNAVKHFKHETRGKRRLHKRPNVAEVEACHPWIDAELVAVRAKVVVGLGATAARCLLGRPVPIAASRTRTFGVGDLDALVTYHPSAVLRADEAAERIRAAIVDDLRRAAELAGDG